MISGLLRWFPGWVRVETEGGYPERLLNDMTAAGMEVWHVHRRVERLDFSCYAAQYRRLRPLARRACVRMRLGQKRGFPFWRHRYRHRKGLLVGAVLYVALLAALSSRVWIIEVEGNSLTPTATVLEQAQRYGVEIGARMKELDIKGMQLYGPDDLPGVAFLTVNPSHCVARIQVTEREPTPQVLDLSQPSDLVAARDGRILQVDARSGYPQVKEGEAVTAGTVLVSGRVETDLGEKLYRSYGEVWAETTRRITVSVPLFQEMLVPAPQGMCQPTITFLCWDFPLYSKRPLQGEWHHQQTHHPLTVRERALPLALTCDYYWPLVTHSTLYTSQQAEEMAREQLAREETAVFLPDSYELLTQTGDVQQGKYVLTATYRCRENIAVEVPLS